ncbi:MAG: Stk1 family PASTA domain-containing Ser/Thr kinase [Oscillospiraceae bacterium]|nr:Stk1 family PASTA domain-containing Ser/Thr kinase [Oscillospiraceae bacterium]
MDLNIGRKLDGRYEITELIGIGGMAHVYKAVDLMEDKVVAVKILKNEYAESEEFLRRFRNESKAIAVLSHPNIVKIFDVGFSDEINFIVMEYIDGITLKEFMEQQKILRWKDAMYFITQVLRALQHAHDRGIVHRDIKPQNIMLFSDGTIKVMDFGIARFSRIDGKTLSDKTIGSVHYISPEQARGDFTDERSDLYSIGVMLYEMLTGTKPFDGDNPVAVALMHMQDTPEMPRDVNPSIPEAVEEIILHAMERNPAKRYQSASEMIKDFDMFKMNPSVVFGYKNGGVSVEDEESTRYFKPVVAPVPHPADNHYDDEDEEDEYEDEEEEEEKRSYVIPILAAVTVAVVIIAVVIIMVIASRFSDKNNGDNRVQVPDFVGTTISEIRENYGEIFNFQTKEEYNSDYAEGVVIKQGTADGATVEKGTTIILTVSRGPQMKFVPDVINLDASYAETELKKYGFTVSKITKPDDSVPTNCVISTEPAPGTEAPKGSTVTIFVCSGPLVNQVQIPKLIGETETDAKTILMGLGVECVVKEVNTSEDKGKVIAQSVKEGEFVQKGSTVEISVSTGIESEGSVEILIPIPEEATGKFKIEVYDPNANIAATSTIDKAELVAGGTKSVSVSGTGKGKYTVYVTNLSTSSDDIKYAVYEVDFTAKKATEESVDKDAFLSILDLRIEVPKFTGMTYDEVVAQYGESFTFTKVEGYNAAPAGEVYAQNQTAGSKVDKGANITLNVSIGPEPTQTEPPVVTAPPESSTTPPEVTDPPVVSDEVTA